MIYVIVGTFAAVPYVHLHLESWRRNCVNVKMGIHDDHSMAESKLKGLCHTYGADFFRTDSRLRSSRGDLSAITCAIEMAAKNDCRFAVKFSRRFVPISNWVTDLLAIDTNCGYHTYSGQAYKFRAGLRTDCIAVNTEAWSPLIPRLRMDVHLGFGMTVEDRIQKYAVEIDKTFTSPKKEAWDAYHPKDRSVVAYADWPFMGGSRDARTEKYLWHDTCTELEYARLAQAWGLPYVEKDFTEPNGGE